jgi:sigma-B regulation protein RsbU (phosphoserine phosphatase)
MFVTLCCAVLDLRSGRLIWANAGHPPPLHLSGKDGKFLTQPLGPPAGVLPDASWEDGEVVLGHGDTILLHTDGLLEARTPATVGPGGETYEDYGAERIRSFVEDHATFVPEELVTAGIEDVRRFAAPSPPHDDLTMIAMRFRG